MSVDTRKIDEEVLNLEKVRKQKYYTVKKVILMVLLVK